MYLSPFSDVSCCTLFIASLVMLKASLIAGVIDRREVCIDVDLKVGHECTDPEINQVFGNYRQLLNISFVGVCATNGGCCEIGVAFYHPDSLVVPGLPNQA